MTQAIVAVLLLHACSTATHTGIEHSMPRLDTYEDAVNTWHRERIERLRGEDGWLSLVGLHWLERGENSVGRADHHDIANDRLPVDDAGVIVLGDDGVAFAPAPGVRADGVPADGRLIDDGEGEPTIVTIGTCRFHVIRRGDRVGIRVKDSEAPTRTGFRGVERFPVDPGWRVDARFVSAEGETIPVASMIGTVSEEPLAGRAHFERDGAECRMVLMPGGAPDRFFVVFGDRTNGNTTYGGGRFVEAVRSEDGARVVIDFNRAYNPPCAFTPYATCPLPVPDNRLPFAVEAGERHGGTH